MKTKSLLAIPALLLIALSVYFIQCTKDKSSQSKLVTSIKTLKSSIDENQAPSGTIRCIDTCENGKKCVWYFELTTFELYCSCSSCKLEITYDSIANNIVKRANIPLIGRAFVSYVKKMHGTDRYGVTYFRHSFYKSTEIIEMQYLLNDNQDEYYSLMFAVSFDPENPNTEVKTVIVDCIGKCDTSQQLCTEVYDPIHGITYCKCQSDSCKMVITEVDPLPLK